jgi:hypothetical protein
MRLYGTIQKSEPQDDGTLIVSGIASTESTDSQGEVITADAIKAAIPDYMRFGAVREMHDAKKAAGTALDISVDLAGATLLTAHIVDPIAIKKVQSGVYKGFSVAGRVLKRDETETNKITAMALTEISLVDRPANPDAIFTCYKAEGADTDDDGDGGDDKQKPDDKDEGDDDAKAKKKKDDESEKATKPDGIAKGCYAISNLARLCEGLLDFASYNDFEATYENAPEDLGTEARGLAVKLYDTLLKLVAFDAEKAKKMLADESSEKADNPADAVRAALGDAIAKAQAIVGSSDGLDEIVKAAGFEPDTPRAEVLANLVTDRERLTKRVKELEAEPAPTKGVLRAVEKADDVSDATVSKGDADEKDPLTLIQKAHQSGGTRLYS